MEIALSVFFKLVIIFPMLYLISLLFVPFVGENGYWISVSLLMLIPAIFESIRFVMGAVKRRMETRSVFQYAETSQYLAAELHPDILNNIRRPFDNLADRDYILTFFMVSLSIIFFGTLPFNVFGIAAAWAKMWHSFLLATIVSTLFCLLLNFIANRIHEKTFEWIEERKDDLATALKNSWKIYDSSLKFNVRDARFEKLFGLENLTVESLASILSIVNIDKREKMVRVLQRVEDERAARTLTAFLAQQPVTESLTVQALVNKGEDAIEPLKDLLHTDDANVRVAAMHALAGIKSPAAVEALVKMLNDENLEVRRAAIWDLNENNSKWIRDEAAKDALAILTAELHEQEPENRAFAAWALGMVKEKSAGGILKEALADESSQVRESAAFALGEIHDSSAADVLATSLNDAAPDVRKSALAALMKIDPERARSKTK